jgi:hypothetical protein
MGAKIFAYAVLLSFVMSCGSDKAAKLTDTQARAALEQNGVSVSSGYCSENRTMCTSLEGMQTATIDGLIALKRHCKKCGKLVITGGTESGHADTIGQSHKNGNKIDISKTQGDGAAFTDYLHDLIKRESSQAAQNGTLYPFALGKHGYIFSEEKNHWDITIK